MYLLTDLTFPCPKIITGPRKRYLYNEEDFTFDTKNGILTYTPKFCKPTVVRHYRVNMPNDPNAYTEEEVFEEMQKDAVNFLIERRGWMLFQSM